jgi:HEAT repeat protein
VLLAAGTSDARPEKTAAAAALVKISGTGAGEAIAQAANAGENNVRILALDTLTARKQTTAIPVVLRCAKDADPGLRRAAFGALGRLAGDKDLDALINLAIETKSPEAYSAIEAAVQRVENKPAAAQKLLAMATDETTQLALLDALSELGGADVLNLMAKLTASANEETRRTAIKAMGNWPDLSATKPLLALAGNPELKEPLHQQALQSIVRLIKEVENRPTDELANVALTAWGLTRQDEEKKLVLSALAYVPHPKAVAALKPLLTDPGFKTDAGQAGLVLAELLMKSNPALGKEMAQAVRDANISSTLTRQANRLLR